MAKISWLLASGVLFLFTSCNKEGAWDCVKTTGDDVVEIRILTPFSSINIKDDFQITIVQDSVNFIELKGGKNVLPKIITDVKDGLLFIENTNTCQTVRSFKREISLEIHTADLELIHNEGVGDITSQDTLFFPSLTLEVVNGIGTTDLLISNDKFYTYIHTGAMDLKVNGKSKDVYLYNAGLGYLFCEGLNTSQLHLNHNSTGDAKVFSNGSVNLENDGIGNVYIYGNPSEVKVSNPQKDNVFNQ